MYLQLLFFSFWPFWLDSMLVISMSYVHVLNCSFTFSIRSIVCLNLPSFSGGLNPWGTPNQKKARYVRWSLSIYFPTINDCSIIATLKFQLWCSQRDLTRPFVDDGLLEVVGFRDAWHGLVLLAPKGHGTRLAQVNDTKEYPFSRPIMLLSTRDLFEQLLISGCMLDHV